MSGRTHAKATPRRKAGRKAPKAKRSIAFRLVVEAQEMLVRYKPDRFEGMAMFEFRSPHRPPRRIVVSSTGYLCHFAPMDEVASFDNVQSYAESYVRSMLDDERKRSTIDHRQLSLFG